MSANVHWPIKHVNRKTNEFLWWACEGCNETFQTKEDFIQHIRGGSKGRARVFGANTQFPNLIHQGNQTRP